MNSLFSRLLFLLVFGLAVTANAKQFRLGVFQAGDYAPNSAAQAAFDRSLKRILPPDTTHQFVAAAFRSAEWNRDSSRAMAKQLAAIRELDMVVAIGPWVVEDLIEAGFTRPIIALYRTDPYLEGLTDSIYRPLYRNLTVQAVPNKLENDIALLHRLKPFKKLGVLFFPSGLDSSRFLKAFSDLAGRLGVEATSAFGHNNSGTYAFLKAYAALPADVDAVYLLPTWGLDAERIKELSGRLLNDRRTSVSFEGLYAVDKGILISSAALPYEAESRFAAWKALQIFRGATPQNLPTLLPSSVKLSINEHTATVLGIDITLEMTTEADLVKPVQGQALELQTLPDLITRALDLNPGQLSWQDQIAQADAQIGLAKTGLRPSLSALGSVGYRDDNRVHNEQLLVPTPELIRNDQYRASLLLDIPLLSVETMRRTRQATVESTLDRLSADSARLALEASVATAYYEVLRLKALRGIQQRQMQLANHANEIARGMVASNERPKGELTRWKAEEFHDRQLLNSLDTDTRIATIYLNALMNQPAASPMLLDSTALTEDAFWTSYELIRPYIVTESARLRTSNQLVEAALSDCPSARRSAEEIKAKKAVLSTVRAANFPTVSLRSSLDIADELESYQSYEEKSTSWSIGAFLRWPIFDGGKRGKEMRISEAKISELEYLRDQTSLQVMKNVSRLLREVAGAAAEAIAAQRESELATALVNAAVEEYTSGIERFEPTARAGLSASDAQRRLVNAHATFQNALYRLACAIGWSPHQESRTPAQLLRQRLSTGK
ncbi:MAG: TolC family protein [bacterium]|nr:TolC family protein [bacterium]